jgi:four helix bundle protein
MRKEMENRLINFSVDLFELSKILNSSFISTHLTNQILRSSTGAALNFAEALSAESRKDFIHKTSIVLKELRETNVNLKIISRMNICKDEMKINQAIQESEELVSIFYKSIDTAKKNGNEVTKGQ